MLLVYFKFLNREDIKFIIDLLKVRTYTDSIKEEFGVSN